MPWQNKEIKQCVYNLLSFECCSNNMQQYLMNKRKIDINQLKKSAAKGTKYRTINVKYEIVLSYFKQKEAKGLKIFQVNFQPLIMDLLEQVSAGQLICKLDSGSKEPIKPVAIGLGSGQLKLDSFELKNISKVYPIQQICECLYVQKEERGGKKILQINKNKLMIFFKHLRVIYPDFCTCVGDKVILDVNDMKVLYEHFKAQWIKNEEKGGLQDIERMEKKICRSLYFLGIVIQNHIFEAIYDAQKKKKEEQTDPGTKSQHKTNNRGMYQQVSSTYSFGSMEMETSNFSIRLKSQKSNQQDFNQRLKRGDYSQKSQKIVSKSKYDLWDKVEMRNLRFFLVPERSSNDDIEPKKYEIDYLSNDVENILIQNAFKIQKLKDSTMHNRYMPYPQYDAFQMSQSYCYVNYGPHLMAPQHYFNPQGAFAMGVTPMQSSAVAVTGSKDDEGELFALKRSLGCLNLAQPRKNTNSRYQ